MKKVSLTFHYIVTTHFFIHVLACHVDSINLCIVEGYRLRLMLNSHYLDR